MASSREGPLTLTTLPDTVPFAHILSQKVLNAVDLHSLACSFKGAFPWCNAEAKRRVAAIWDKNYLTASELYNGGPDPDDSPDGEWPIMTKELALNIAKQLVKCTEQGERADWSPALNLMSPKWLHRRRGFDGPRPIKRPGDSWLRVYFCEDGYRGNHDYGLPLVADTAVLRSLLSSHNRVADVLRGLSPSDRSAVDRLCGSVVVVSRTFESEHLDDNLETSGFTSEVEFALVKGGRLLSLKHTLSFEDYGMMGCSRLSLRDCGREIATAETVCFGRIGPTKVRLRFAWETLKRHGDLDASVSLTALGAFLRAVLVCFDEMDYYGVAPAEKDDDLSEPDPRDNPTLRGWPSLFHAPYRTMVQIEQLFKFLRVEGAYAACACRVDWGAVAYFLGLEDENFGEFLFRPVGPHFGWLLHLPHVRVSLRCGELNARMLLDGDWTADCAGSDGDDAAAEPGHSEHDGDARYDGD